MPRQRASLRGRLAPSLGKAKRGPFQCLSANTTRLVYSCSLYTQRAEWGCPCHATECHRVPAYVYSVAWCCGSFGAARCQYRIYLSLPRVSRPSTTFHPSPKTCLRGTLRSHTSSMTPWYAHTLEERRRPAIRSNPSLQGIWPDLDSKHSILLGSSHLLREMVRQFSARGSRQRTTSTTSLITRLMLDSKGWHSHEPR